MESLCWLSNNCTTVMWIRIRWIRIIGGCLDPDPHGEMRIRIWIQEVKSAKFQNFSVQFFPTLQQTCCLGFFLSVYIIWMQRRESNLQCSHDNLALCTWATVVSISYSRRHEPQSSPWATVSAITSPQIAWDSVSKKRRQKLLKSELMNMKEYMLC